MIWGLLGAVAIVALGAGLVLWLRRKDGARRDGFQALAARRGWALTLADQSLGRPAFVRLTSRSGPAWQVETRRGAGTGPVLTGQGTTEFVGSDFRWPAGLLVIVPKADAMPGESVDRPSRQALAALIGDELARRTDELRLLPGPDGQSGQWVILGTKSPEGVLDLKQTLRRLSTGIPDQAGAASGPAALILARDGLRLRLRQELLRSEDLERFTDLGLSLIERG